MLSFIVVRYDENWGDLVQLPLIRPYLRRRAASTAVLLACADLFPVSGSKPFCEHFAASGLRGNVSWSAATARW
jgi:hypothetical protein